MSGTSFWTALRAHTFEPLGPPTIFEHGQQGLTFQRLYGEYARDAKAVVVTAPYLLQPVPLERLRQFLHVLFSAPLVEKVYVCTDTAIGQDSVVNAFVKRVQNTAATHGVELLFAHEPGLHWREIHFIGDSSTVRVENDRGIDHLQGRPTGVPEIERSRKFKLQSFKCGVGYGLLCGALDQLYPRCSTADAFTHDEALKLARTLTISKLRGKIRQVRALSARLANHEALDMWQLRKVRKQSLYLAAVRLAKHMDTWGTSVPACTGVDAGGCADTSDEGSDPEQAVSLGEVIRVGQSCDAHVWRMWQATVRRCKLPYSDPRKQSLSVLRSFLTSLTRDGVWQTGGWLFSFHDVLIKAGFDHQYPDLGLECDGTRRARSSCRTSASRGAQPHRPHSAPGWHSLSTATRRQEDVVMDPNTTTRTPIASKAGTRGREGGVEGGRSDANQLGNEAERLFCPSMAAGELEEPSPQLAVHEPGQADATAGAAPTTPRNRAGRTFVWSPMTGSPGSEAAPPPGGNYEHFDLASDGAESQRGRPREVRPLPLVRIGRNGPRTDASLGRSAGRAHSLASGGSAGSRQANTDTRIGAGPRADGRHRSSAGRRVDTPRQNSRDRSSVGSQVRPSPSDARTLRRRQDGAQWRPVVPQALGEPSSGEKEPTDALESIRTFLRSSADGGAFASAIGGRFRVKLPFLEQHFLLTRRTSTDAWVSAVPHTNVYIEQLERTMTMKELRATCSRIAPVISSKFVVSSTGTRKRALVQFSSLQGAAEALRTLTADHPEWQVRSADRAAT